MITLGIDSKEIKPGMDKAESVIASSAKHITDNVLKPLAAAFALGSAFHNYMANALSLGTLSDTLGISASEIDAWGAAAEAAGGSAEGLQGSLTSLNSKLNEFANTGTSSAAPALAQLGISARNSAGEIKSSTDILKELSAASERISPKRFEVLTGSLGIDAGTILLLKQGAAGLDEILDRQYKLGTYSQKDAEIAAKLKTAFDDLTRVFRSIASIVMQFLLPPLTWLTDKFTNIIVFLKGHEVFLKGVIAGIASVLTAVLLPAIIKIGAAMLTNPLTWIFIAIAAVVMLVAVVIEDLYVYMQGGESALSGFWAIFGTGEEITKKLSRAWELLKTIFGAVISFACECLKTLIRIIGSVCEVAVKFGSYLGHIFDLLKAVFTFDGEGIKKAFSGLLSVGGEIADVFIRIGGYIKDLFLKFLDVIGLKEPFLNFFNALAEKAAVVFGKIKEFLEPVIEAVVKFGSYLGHIFDLLKAVFSFDGEGIKKAFSGLLSVGGEIADVFIRIGGYIKDLFLKFLDVIGLKEPFLNFFNALAEKAAVIFGKIKEFLEPVIEAVKAVAGGISGVAGFIGNKISGGISGIAGGISAAVSFFKGGDEEKVSPAESLTSNVNNSSKTITNTSSVNVGNINVTANSADPAEVAKKIPEAMNNYNTFSPANAAVAY